MIHYRKADISDLDNIVCIYAQSFKDDNLMKNGIITRNGSNESFIESLSIITAAIIKPIVIAGECFVGVLDDKIISVIALENPDKKLKKFFISNIKSGFRLMKITKFKLKPMDWIVSI